MKELIPIYAAIVLITIIWIIVDQVQGYIQLFKSWKRKEEELKPLDRNFLRKNTLISLIYPVFVFEITAPLILLGGFHPLFYLLIILPAFAIYAIFSIISNFKNIDDYVSFDRNTIVEFIDDPFQITVNKSNTQYQVSSSNLNRIVVTKPMVLQPPNQMFGTADFELNDKTTFRITLITIGDPTLLFKQKFKGQLKTVRSWSAINPKAGNRR